MTEQFEKLEAELAAMQPRMMREDVLNGIGERMNPEHSTSWSDRCLCFAMSAGAIAACMIVAMLLMQSGSSSAPATPSSVLATATPPRLGDSALMFARADAGWVERLK